MSLPKGDLQDAAYKAVFSAQFKGRTMDRPTSDPSTAISIQHADSGLLCGDFNKTGFIPKGFSCRAVVHLTICCLLQVLAPQKKLLKQFMVFSAQPFICL